MKKRFRIKDPGRFIFLSLIALITLGFLVSRYQKVVPLPKGFYRVENNELGTLLKKSGIDFSIFRGQKVQRNNTGTSLWIKNRDAPERVILSCDGSIRTVDLPYSYSWIDENEELVAWYILESGITHYRGGFSESGKLLIRGMDSTGSYLWKYLGKMKAGIFSTDDPGEPIVVLENFFLKLFRKNDELHILGNKSIGNIGLYIFKIAGKDLIPIKEYEIRRSEKMSSLAIFVIDYNIETGDIVLDNSNDPPFKSKWYLYNINQEEFRYLGDISDHGFFLDCDIVKEVSVRLETLQ
jgi:hypothetical protein